MNKAQQELLEEILKQNPEQRFILPMKSWEQTVQDLCCLIQYFHNQIEEKETELFNNSCEQSELE